MSTKFFNNVDGTLFDKLKAIAQAMPNFDRFLAVAGFFRSSGYFKMSKELGEVKEIKILVGINIDDIYREINRGQLFMGDEERSKEIYGSEFKQDIIDAQYKQEIEDDIIQMGLDILDGKLELRIHLTKNLHAKFYLCLPMEHTEDTDGWVIMGSSSLSDDGLDIEHSPHHELNVASNDYDDVKYCYNEFMELWNQASPLTWEDIEKNMQGTYLGYQPTPYELYIKVLISALGNQVEDKFTMKLPSSVLDLKYQRDAVVQGYQTMMKYNGVFLADVVGLGKTVIATMIAKRFIEENGDRTNILVVYPPALKENWETTFRLFNIYRRAQFISNGRLSEIVEGRHPYRDMEEFDMIIVDEAHRFRNDDSKRYDNLQKICKSKCANNGNLGLLRKRVLLLSATPLNNGPADLQNQLLLFQDGQNCTIDGISNINGFFADKNSRYDQLMRSRNSENENTIKAEVDKLYEEIRVGVIDKITIRRTRFNILNNPDYKKDLDAQGIVFPIVESPQTQTYQMSSETSNRFYRTLSILSDEDALEHLTYARYRVVEFLKPELRDKYPKNIGEVLKSLYRVHMVKRLESSFHAFKISLQSLLRITKNMINMFAEDKVLIIPDINVNDLLSKGLELDEIIEKAIEKGYLKEDITFKAEDFVPEFLPMLQHDKEILIALNEEWKKEDSDPKFDTFRKGMEELFFNDNETGKLVIFSESVDTLDYLYKRITEEIGRKDVIEVTSKDRIDKEKRVKENFDANHNVKKNEYNIILSSDVLAEGVNLHRSNVIINYDTPWNASRLLQRIGRVNRIGTKAKRIHNYIFYPSQQGDEEIGLYMNALIKLQGIHSAFGEDAQIYSEEEIVKQFELFNTNVRDSVDEKIEYLREVRELYNSDEELYNKIKALPMKSRAIRNSDKHKGSSIVFIQSKEKTEFYYGNNDKIEPIDFMEAARILKADKEEKPSLSGYNPAHYNFVNKAINNHKSASVLTIAALDSKSQKAKNFLNSVIVSIENDKALSEQCKILISFIENGTYNKLPKRINDFMVIKKLTDGNAIVDKKNDVRHEIFSIVKELKGVFVNKTQDKKCLDNPQVVISESFV